MDKEIINGQHTIKIGYTPAELAQVLFHLEFKNWVKADDLKSATNIPKRTLRYMAEKSGKIISGNKGYKHASNASQDELWHCINMCMSRSKSSLSRASLLKKFVY